MNLNVVWVGSLCLPSPPRAQWPSSKRYTCWVPCVCRHGTSVASSLSQIITRDVGLYYVTRSLTDFDFYRFLPQDVATCCCSSTVRRVRSSSCGFIVSSQWSWKSFLDTFKKWWSIDTCSVFTSYIYHLLNNILRQKMIYDQCPLMKMGTDPANLAPLNVNSTKTIRGTVSLACCSCVISAITEQIARLNLSLDCLILSD
jgi:hypothetical protein